MEIIKVKSTRRNIGGPNSGEVWQNIIRAGRKIVAEIYEPCDLLGDKYSVSVRVAPGYTLNAKAETMQDAIAAFDRLTDGKYIFA